MKKIVEKKGFFSALSIALVLFSSHAGGGFATGNQANTYFVNLGWTGIVSVFISMWILTAMIKEAMIMTNTRGLKSYKELFENLYHPFDRLEILFEAFYYVMVIMVVATTISGAASAVEEYLHFGYMFGVLAIGILILVLTIFGAKLVRVVGTYMGVGILITSLAIYAVGSFKGESFIDLMKIDLMTNGLSMLPKAVISGFVYAGFQCVQIPAMVACGNVLKKDEEISFSMKIAWVINTLALALSVIMLISWKGYYSNLDGGTTLPTLVVTKALGYEWISVFYVITLILCLISSGVTVTFGLVTRLEKESLFNNFKSEVKARFTIAFLIIVVSVLISFAGLTNIIKYGYGYCGYLAIFAFILPLLTVGVYKNRNYGKNLGFEEKLVGGELNGN